MQASEPITHCAGFDWARDHHAVVVVDQAGTIVAEFKFAHDQEGRQSFRDKTQGLANLAIAIETNQGIVVEQLLQYGYRLYPVAAASYRQRKTPSGTETNHFDAWALADALRLEGQGWKPLQPLDEQTLQLRLLCQDQMLLIQQRTLLINQLRQALVAAGRRRWEKFLHTHRLWRPETAAKRLAIFARAAQFGGSLPWVKAKSQLALSLCRVLRSLQAQLEQYRQQIKRVFDSHPDRDLFGSLPGAKQVLAPRLLAAVGADPNRYDNRCEVLQAFAGTAPISFQSGQLAKTRIRRACDKFLRQTVPLWANCFRRRSGWGRAYYQKKRAAGKSHACALRCLGQRLLKILLSIILHQTPYDAQLHARNQLKHGSWVLSLVHQNAPA